MAQSFGNDIYIDGGAEIEDHAYFNDEISVHKQINSLAPVGMSPFTVTSGNTALNIDFNADLLDGYHSGSFAKKAENETITANWVFTNAPFISNPSTNPSAAVTYSQLTAAIGSGIAGSTNYISKFTGINTIINSQIFDNGTSVAIGHASPAYKLDVAGTIRTSTQFRADIAIGTSPFVVTSTTMSPNLNADLLDGYHAIDFPRKNEIATITANRWVFSYTPYVTNTSTDPNVLATYGQLTTALGSYVTTATTISVLGTSGRITSSAGAQSLAANRTWTLDLATSGVSASTYKSVTVDVYGRVTGGTNPTTLAGYGITDAATTTDLTSYVRKASADTITASHNFTGLTLTLSGEMYTNLYPSTNQTYMSFYPNGGNGANITTANLQVWDGAGWVKVLNFGGDGTFTWDGANVALQSWVTSNFTPQSRTLTINGTGYNLSTNRSWSVGTVTSVALNLPTGLTVSGSPITTSGTFAVTFTAGYSIPTTTKQGQWDTAYSSLSNYVRKASADTITASHNFTGLTLTLSGEMYTNLYPSTNQTYMSFYPNGGNGANITTANLQVWDGAGWVKVLNFGGDGTFTWDGANVALQSWVTSNFTPQSRTLTINGTGYNLSTNRSWSVGTVTSVALNLPTGLTVSGSPITTSGTLAVTFTAGYSIPTTTKQGQWDTAYGWNNHAGLYAPISHNLTYHSDVTISGASTGQLLRWNGSAWANWTPDFGSGTITGTGSSGYFTKWTGTNSLSYSTMSDTGTEINIGSGRTFGVEGYSAFRGDAHFHSVVRMGTASYHGRMVIHNETSADPHSSAAFEIRSTSRGFLPPRMTYAQMTAISSPAEFLIIGTTDSGGDGKGIYIYTNVYGWVRFLLDI